jgi:hypothetical protein
METIDVTSLGEDMFALNHDAFSSKRSVIDDVGRLLISGTYPPHIRTPKSKRARETREAGLLEVPTLIRAGPASHALKEDGFSEG